jgi:4-amino-4-deoxy-L-arabinose transferase-like glycosyltransferase
MRRSTGYVASAREGGPLSGRPSPAERALLIVALLLGLGIRLAIVWHTPDLEPKIADELHYVELAESLVSGRGFAWASGEPTSLRPPLYPALVASIWTAAGERNHQAMRLVQIVLSLLTAALVFELGRRTVGASAAALAAALTWLYPDFIFLNSLILTETLFTLLLVAFVLLTVVLVQQPRGWTALACGVALGLATLTRSVLWPMPVLLCPLLAVLLPLDWKRRLLLPATVLLGFVLVVTPWAIRNTRLQGVVTIVDTMGGINLRMGNYEHTPEERMWDAVSMTGEKNWVYALEADRVEGLVSDPVTEGVKDKWAQRRAIQYILANPGTTLRRSVIKFTDFWGLERSFLAGVQQGLYDPPRWFAFAAFGLMLLSYVAIALMAAAGIWLTRPAWPAHVLLLLPVVLITGIHSVVFGHARYHLPLMPILTLYAAAMWQQGLGHALSRRGWTHIGALLSVLLLVGIWLRQVLIVDAPRIRALFGQLWS